MIGQAIRRREDGRFLTGAGRYVSDLALPDALHVAVVRSPHAHARVCRIEAAAAHAHAGVLDVFVLEDLPELRGALPPPALPGAPIKPHRQSGLADGAVRFVGEPVAAVLAADAYAAADGAEAVRVAYEPLAAVVDPERAVEPGAPLVHPDWGSNVAASVALERGDVDAARRRPHLVVTRRFRCGRHTALPLEPRGVARDGTRSPGPCTCGRARRCPTASGNASRRRSGSSPRPCASPPLTSEAASARRARSMAIANAVADALGDLATPLTEIPLRPERLAAPPSRDIARVVR